MLLCTRKGCGKHFEQGSTESCVHHSGGPVFHEGLKSWSCCNNINKPVLDFDEFMSLPGCTEAACHTDEPLKAEAPKSSSTTTFTMSESGSGKETYSAGSLPVPASMPPPPFAAAPVEVEEDDLNVVIAPGTACRRNGCKATFVSDAVNRQGDGEGTICTYHSAPPIFREGSKVRSRDDSCLTCPQSTPLVPPKGYLCCKRRVLEFDEFLKIGGCKTGKHLFSPPKSDPVAEVEVATCRVDHYQTANEVHVSIYAKKADKDRSIVEFEETQVKFTIILPGSKKFSRTLDLFGPIDPKQSTYEVLGTKVELHLRKRDGRSWTLLEKTSQNIGNISLTFGVGGRTGTIGAKEFVFDDVNQVREVQ